jgi:hypothetical protein
VAVPSPVSMRLGQPVRGELSWKAMATIWDGHLHLGDWQAELLPFRNHFSLLQAGSS